jgi:hypothetical protein
VSYESSVSVIYTSEMYSHNTNYHTLLIFLSLCAQALELQRNFRVLLLNRSLLFRYPKFSSPLTSVLRVSVIQDASFLNFLIGCPLYTIIYHRLSLLCTTHQKLSPQYQTPLLPLTSTSFSGGITFEFCYVIN